MRWAIKHKSGRTLFVTSDEFIVNNRRKMGWIVEKVKMTSREQFDVWFEKFIGCNVNHALSVVMAERYWRVWQESRAAIEIDLSNMHLLLCDQNDVIDELTKHNLKVKI